MAFSTSPGGRRLPLRPHNLQGAMYAIHPNSHSTLHVRQEANDTLKIQRLIGKPIWSRLASILMANVTIPSLKAAQAPWSTLQHMYTSIAGSTGSRMEGEIFSWRKSYLGAYI